MGDRGAARGRVVLVVLVHLVNAYTRGLEFFSEPYRRLFWRKKKSIPSRVASYRWARTTRTRPVLSIGRVDWELPSRHLLRMASIQPTGGSAWYNEIDREAVLWLRELIRAGDLPSGVVSDADVADVTPDEIGAGDAHFFAGIGGWPLALKRSWWPASVPLWTGSCPCQPFSTAGSREGEDDERHVWPDWFSLIRELRPQYIVGEQVASPDAHGWMRGVQRDLESIDYAVGYAVLPAAGFGAPHLRERLWWCAALGWVEDADGGRPDGAHPSEAQARPAEGSPHSAWRSNRRLYCPFDQRERRVPTADAGIPIVADGISARVAISASAGFGNSIVPVAGTTFINAFGCATGVIP